jgi:hypothetical protein
MQYKRISWWFIAMAPIIEFVMLGAWLVADGYNGHCGLLDAGWECSKSEFILDSLLNPLVLPVLLIYSVAWLIIVGIVAAVVRVFRREQRATT